YEPTIPVYIVRSSFDSAIREMKKRQEIVGLLASDEVVKEFQEHVEASFSLCEGKDVNMVNRRLFNGLRTLEQSKASVILVETFDEGDLSAAYMNRLQNAANKKSI